MVPFYLLDPTGHPLPVAGGGTQVTCGSALLSGRLLVNPQGPASENLESTPFSPPRMDLANQIISS